MTTTYSPDDVAAFEHAAWSRCAPGYRDGFSVLTDDALEPLLDAVHAGEGTRLLDVGTGPGTAAAAAIGRGATVAGIDFSDAMLTEARRTVPEADLRTASADALPFGDGALDAVIANSVLHHLATPAEALREAHRVLRPGGRIACTVWDDPSTLEAFGLFFAAVEQHAGEAELPHGPLFGVTDRNILTSLFTAAGFGQADVTTLPTSWRMTSIESLLRSFAT